MTLLCLGKDNCFLPNGKSSMYLLSNAFTKESKKKTKRTNLIPWAIFGNGLDVLGENTQNILLGNLLVLCVITANVLLVKIP